MPPGWVASRQPPSIFVRQKPDMQPDMGINTSTVVGFIGAARLGASLAVAMSRCGYRVGAVHRRSTAAAEAVANRIPGAISTTDAQRIAGQCGIVFVTTGEAAIESVVDSLDWGGVDAVVHCSGATPVSSLASAAGLAAATGGFHPMQTFPNEHGDARFEGVTVAIESESSELRAWLAGLADALGAHHIFLTPEMRPPYHASAVMACGLVAGLVGLAADMWQEMGLTREDGLRALSPLVSATAEQIGDLGIPAAITGPYARGDVETVQAHLDATRRRGRDVFRAYAGLALAQLPIAREQGNISEEEYATIEALLRGVIDSLNNVSGSIGVDPQGGDRR